MRVMAKDKQPADEQPENAGVGYALRFDDSAMYAVVRRVAKAQRRSINDQILIWIEAAMRESGDWPLKPDPATPKLHEE